MNAGSKKDFFVSYNQNDRRIAEWIAWVLEEEGYSTVIQAWDFGAGGNFVLDMQQAAIDAERTIAVLSRNSLKSEFVQAEWAAAFKRDPSGKERRLMPIRVGDCQPLGLWAQIVYVDLVGKEKEEAKELIRCAAVAAVKKVRGKPSQEPEYVLSSHKPEPIYPPSIAQNLPRINDVFVGRELDLEELHQKLQTGRATAISAIAGMGGIGKTELAAQYAVQHRDLGTYPGGICWLKGREELGTQIVGFGRSRLHLSIPEEVELSEQVHLCWAQWRAEESLIVFDDVQEYVEIEPFLPPQRSHFKVLLTTRSRFGSPVQNHEIKVLSEAASLNLLRAIVSDERIDQDLETAKQVCEWLGYLPLGLELVGRYLARRKGTSIVKLWERLQAQKLAAKALLEAEPGMTASLGVTAAFELSWQELDLKAQQLAALLSLFALAEIPWSLVQACLPEADEEELEDLREEQLVNLSLLSFEGGENYQLHQLLREFFAVKRSQMPEDEEWKRSFCAVMSAIANQMPTTWTLASIEQFSATIPHLKESATTLEAWLADEDVYKPGNRLGQFYEGQSVFWEAEEWYLHCRSLLTQRLGKKHIGMAISLSNLARLYQLQGRYEEAEPLFTQALELCQSLFDKYHPYIALSLNNLALLYESQGRYKEAELLFIQALELHQLLFDKNRPEVATSLHNLARLYRSQGRYEQAEPLFIQALQLMRSLLGENHPDVATSLGNLAELYFLQGRYEEAEPLYIQTLQLTRSLFDEKHPHVAASLHNLAAFYKSQRYYEQAESLLIQALELRRFLFGENHPAVAASLHNLAELYRSLERYEQAEPFYLQALQLMRSLLGENHPDVATSLGNLAGLYRSLERYEQAESLFIQTLQIHQRILGQNHPHVAAGLNNLAGLYITLERFAEVEPLYLRAIAILYEQLGANHPTTETAWGNFLEFLRQVIQRDRTAELSNHSITRSLLQQLQNEES
ncbi:tetratricopeptide repeat protein [Leptolyngbya sp. AN03gr2]|uniref:tetratricopeptide repeat protein n=1 Tax=unclassified Leptolyngbya TaxID=2650499 RepID=UPI003D313378